jgi:hypothetical protein
VNQFLHCSIVSLVSLTTQSLQAQAGRDRTVVSEHCIKYKHTGIDLIIADIPENLPVPGISTSVPEWNKRAKSYTEDVFEMADAYLHDDGALVLIHCDDRALMREIEDKAHQYDMKLLKDWWGINEMHLALPRDPSMTVSTNSTQFYVSLYYHLLQYLECHSVVESWLHRKLIFEIHLSLTLFTILCVLRLILQSVRFWIQLFVRREVQSKFSFTANRGKNYMGDHVEKSDALFNVTDDDMTMNGSVPWRGAREKNQPFFHLLIQQFCKAGDVVLDCKAATGMLQ